MAIYLSVVDKTSHKEVSVQGLELTLHSPSVIRLKESRSNIKHIEREGDTLSLTLMSGVVIKVHGFFSEHGPRQNDLVLQDDQRLWWLEVPENGQVFSSFVPIDSIEPLLLHESFDFSTLAWVLGGLALAGGAAGGGAGGGDHSNSDQQAPSTPYSLAAPTFTLQTNADGSVTVAGSAPAGSTVLVTFPDGTHSSAAAGSDGHFSTTSGANLPSGPVSANSTDSGGHSSPSTTLIYTDITAPDAPLASVSVNPDGSLTVSGSAEPGSTVHITYPDGSASSAVADSSGHYSTHSVTPQTSGTVEAIATDAAGNHSAPTDVPYTNTLMPAATAAITGISDDMGTSPNDYVTRDTTLVVHLNLTGSLNPALGDTVQVSVDGGLTWHDAGLVGGSTYAFDNSSQPLASGSHEFAARVINWAGNASPLDTRTVVIDTTAPVASETVTIVSISTDTGLSNSDFITSDNTLLFNGDLIVPLISGEGVRISLDGATTWHDAQVIGSRWSYDNTANPLADGSYNVQVQVIDEAGNIGQVATQTVVVDTLVPAASETISIDAITRDTGTSASDFITGDTSLVFSGSLGSVLAAGEGVRGSLDGGITWQGAQVVGSSWSYDNSANTLADGTYNLQVQVIDTAGNIGQSASRAIVINTAAPDASETVAITSITRDSGASASDFITSDTSLVFNGTLGSTLAAGEEVRISLDGGGTWQSANVLGSNWSVDNTANALADGTYNLQVQVINTAGNIGQSASQTLVVDTVASATSIHFVSITTDTGANSDDFITSDSSLVFNGTLGSALASGEGVRISLDGGATWHDASVGGSHWSYDNSAHPLADGSYNVQVQVIDAAGNIGQGATQVLVIDSTAPDTGKTIAIASITTDTGVSASDFITRDSSLVFNGTLGSALASDEGVRISLDGGLTWQDATIVGSSWSYDNTAIALADGTYNVQVQVIDTAGNIGQSASQTLVIDSAAPGVGATLAISAITSDTGASSTDFITSDTSLIFNGTLGTTLAAGEGVRISLDGGGTWQAATVVGSTWSYDNRANTLAEGSYNVRVQIIDAAGNIGQSASQPVVVAVDSTAPDASKTITIASVTTDTGASAGDFITGDNRLLFNGVLGSPLDSDEGVRISLDGGITWQGASVVGSTWSYDNSAHPLIDATYNVQVQVIDMAGNIGQGASRTLVIDSAAPDASETIAIVSITTDTGISSNDFITRDSSLLFNGTLGSPLASGEGVRISLDNGATWHDANVAGSSWSYDNSAQTLVDGTYSLQVQVVDTAGNIGHSASQTLVIDSAAPDASETIAIVSITTDTGTSSSDFITHDATLVFTGTLGSTLAAGDGVRISLDAGLTWQDASVNGTDWSYDNSAYPLADGTYNLQVQVIDTAGNIGQSASQVLVIDSIAPAASETITIASITTDTGASASDFITRDTSLIFNGTLGSALAAGEGVRISLDGGTTWQDASVNGSNWSYDNSARPLVDGTYNLQVQVIDTAGNVGQSATRVLVIDTDAPAASKTIAIAAITQDTGTSSSDFITQDHSLRFDGTLGAALSSSEGVQISLDGGVTWSNASVSATAWSYDNSANLLADGIYNLQARVIDSAGNIGQSTSRDLVIDNLEPGSTVNSIAISDDTGSSSTDGITQDTSLVISATVAGALDPGDQVQISLDDGLTWNTATLVGGNTYALDNSAQPLADGTYTFEARVVDAAGNSSALFSKTVVIDTSAPLSGNSLSIDSYSDNLAPQAGNFPSGSSTNDTTPLLNGSVSGLSSGDIVQVYQGSTLLGNATVSGGSWTYQLGALAQGNYTYHGVIVDAAGNPGTPSADFNLSVDTTAPTQTLAFTGISDDRGVSSSDFITDDNTLLLSGTLSTLLVAGEVVQVGLDGGQTLRTATVNGTTWSLDLTGSVLADGTYHVQAWVIDAAGNKGPVASQDMQVDTQAPGAGISFTAITQDTGSSASDFITRDSSLIFSGTLGSPLDSGEYVQLSLDGGATWLTAANNGAIWSYDNSGQALADGSYNLAARVIDQAGNVGNQASQTLVVDSLAPTAGNALAITGYFDNVAPQAGSFANGSSTNDSTPLLIGSVSGLSSGDIVQVYQGGTLLGTATVVGGAWSYPLAPLTDGYYTYHAVIVDAAGNQGTASADFSLTLDTQTPAASETLAITAISTDTGVSSSDFITADNTLSVSGTLGATLVAGEGVQVSFDGGSTWNTASVIGTAWSYDHSATVLADGSYSLLARVVDAAGNIGQGASRSLTVDTAAPLTTVSISGISQDTGISGSDFLTSDNTLQFFGGLSSSLAAGETVQLSLDGGTTWLSTQVSGASWSYDHSATVLADGTYNLLARVIDSAGNPGNSTSQVLQVNSAAASGNNIAITGIGNDTGLSASDFITNDTTLGFTGLLSAPLAGDQRVELSLDGGASWQAANVVGSAWSYDNTANVLSDGSYQVQARIIDIFDNVEQTTRQTLVVDTSAPAASETVSILSVTSDTGASASDFITSDSSLMFNGALGSALAAGDGVQISLDGGASWHQAQVNGGTWSYDNTASSLADGTYNLQVRVIDEAGNVGQGSSQVLVIDTGAPSATSSISAISNDSGASGSDFITRDSTLLVAATLSGTLGSGESVQISTDGGGTWHSATLLGGSTYQYDNSATVLDDGSYSFLSRVIDAAGNAGSVSSQTVQVDTRAPTASASISAIGNDTGSSGSDFITADNTLLVSATLSGTLDTGESVQISTDGGSTWHGATLLGGNIYQYDNSASVLVDGSYNFQARVVDSAGNASAANSQLVRIDTTAPGTVIAITGVSPDTGASASDFITSANRLVFSGTLGSALASGEGVQISLDGGLTWRTAGVSGSTWSYDNSASPLADGSYDVQVRVIDAAGNSGGPVSRSLELDSSAPTASVSISAITQDTGVAGDFITGDNSLLVNATLTGTLGSGESVQISTDGGSTWHSATLLAGSTYQYDHSATTLADGSYSFQARVIDTAGNTGAVSNQAVQIDTGAPSTGNSVAILGYTDDVAPQVGFFGNGSSTNDTAPLLRGSVSGLGNGDRVQIYQGATLLGTAVISAGTWNYQLGTLGEGSYSYSAVITDTAGNPGTSSTSFNLTVDTTAPSASTTIAITGVTNDTASIGDFITSDTSLVFNGTLGSALVGGEQVQISLNGGSTWQAASVSGSTWTYDNSANVLGDGTYSLVVRVVDGAGNLGQSASQTLVIDSVAPDATITIASVTQDTGISSGDFITSDSTLVFNGTLGSALVLGEGVRISLDGGATWHNAGVSGSTWSYDYSANALAAASYSVIVQVIDSAGNIGNSASQTLVVDSTAPGVSITIAGITSDTGSSGSDFNTSDKTLSFNGNLGASLVSGESVQISLNGGSSWQAASVSGSTWSYDNTSNTLADGSYSVQVRVVDTAGNIGNSASQMLVIDSVAPGASISIAAITSDTGSSASDFITSDKTLIFNGNLGANLGSGEAVQISLNGGSSWQAASVTGTTWSFNNTANTLADGSYSLQARVIDSAGNIGNSASQTLVIDSVAPVATISIAAITTDTGSSASDFNTSDKTLIFNGTLGASLGTGESVQISLNGGSTWQAASVSGSTWSYDNTGNSLADGSYSLQVRVIDSAGNIGSQASQTLVVDSTAPATTISITAITSDTGSSASDFITNDKTLVFNGSLGASPGSGESVQISLNDGSTWQAASVSGSTWSYDNTGTPLADGSYLLQVRVIDSAGNIGNSASQTLVVDSTAPSATLTIAGITTDTGSSASDFVTSDKTLILNGNLGASLGSGEGVQISLNGGSNWQAASVTATSWSFNNTASSLADGSYSVQVRVVDTAGNIGNQASQTLVVDSAAPVATISIGAITTDTGSSASDFNTSDKTLVFNGSLGASLGTGESVQISLNGGSTWQAASVSGSTWSYDNTGNALADGSYSVQVQVVDLAGNIGSQASQTLVVDSVAPGATISIAAITTDTGSSASDFITSDKTLVFNGTLGASLGSGESVQISLNGGSTWQAASVTGTTWSFNNTGNTLADGSYSLQVRVIDSAGNSGNSASQTLLIDSVAPVATAVISGITQDAGASASDFITNDQTLLITATTSVALGAGEVVQISLNGGTTWQNASFVSGSTWQLDNTGNTLAAASYTFAARVVDAAGNTGSSSTQAVVINTTAPAVTGLSLSSSGTDTAAGLALGTASTTNTATNSDLITRAGSLGVSGTYTGTLVAGDQLQLSSDGGLTWNAATFNNATHTWSYLDPNDYAGPVTYQVRTMSQAGAVGTFSTTQVVNIDAAAPLQNLLAPVLASAYDSGAVGDHITTNTAMTFTSVQSRTGSAGATLVLVNDVNNDGIYSEGIDRVLGSTTVAGDGSWSLSVSGLASGAYHLGFIQVDTAGNRSRLSYTNEVDVVAVNDHAAAVDPGWSTAPTTSSPENKGTAYTLGNNGLWLFYSNLALYSSTGLTSYTGTSLEPIVDTRVSNVTFVDYNRDGNLDIMGLDVLADGQQSWTYNGTSYSSFQLAGTGGSANVNVTQGGIVAYDKNGDGYIDLAYGDATSPGDAQVPGGIDSQLLVNNSGTYTKDSNFVQTPTGNVAAPTNGQPLGEISGVDINNDGTVDLVFHQRNPSAAGSNTLSVLSNSGTGALGVTFSLAGVFASPGSPTSTVSMTWGDFNGDGYMDLLLGGGVTGSDGTAFTANESRIYFNNQSGGLIASPLWLGDTLAGGASLALDWNHDGAMDVIELLHGTTGAPRSPINLYLNNGTGSAWATSALVSSTGILNGAVAADYDWDGGVDLIYFGGSNGTTQWVQNTNTVQAGTSLHLRILDANGVTSYYGNTVQLYDASGRWVANQIINPQSGNNTNDSSSIVNFYGLDASQTYTVVLLRNVNGVSADIGGLASAGGNSVENLNLSWSGLATGVASSAYVLSGEGGGNSANGNFIGTGYNDTFFATAGSDTYNGSGGWNNARFGPPVWSAGGGEDVLDYRLAGNTAITLDLNSVTAQNSGFNIATLIGIEGLRGAGGNDRFTASTAAGVNNLLEGRGGNDSFILGATGGHATLVYNLLDASDATAGNGSDTATGFALGSVAGNANADVIDLSSLLSSYAGSAYVYRDTLSGKYLLDPASRGLGNYLTVTSDASNTYLSVDLNGSGVFSAGHLLLTLTGVVTDLATLLANNQLLLTSSTANTVPLLVNSLSTSDSTPIISGSLPSALASGSHLEVTLNGVSYSSATGQVVIDPANNTWYLQVPNANALATGTYEVNAAVLNSAGRVLTQDVSHNELALLAAPSGITTVVGETGNISAPGMAVGDVNNDGLFDYFNATSLYTQTATSNATLNQFSGQSLYVEGVSTGQLGKVSSVQFLDFLRGGNLSLMTSQSATAIPGNYYFVNNGDGISYTKVNYANVTDIYVGTQVAIDLNNDGYIDLIQGDKSSGDAASYSLNNQNGTYTNYTASSSVDPLSQAVNGFINENVGAFDLNGDGRVDLLGQFWGGTWGGAINDLGVLLAGAGGATSVLAATVGAGTVKRVSNVYYHVNSSAPLGYWAGAQSVNVADFNGDGTLDLFVGQSSTHTATSSVYTSDGSGTFTLATTLASSTLTAGVSVNTDWNGDGKLDVFEFADNGANSATLATQTTYEYWQNTTASAGGAPSFVRTAMSVSSVASATSIMGAVTADFNYDGAQDLIINANGADVLVVNPNVIAAGTSLHLKIENPAGGNTYISQTVNLYDSNGVLVETRVLNGQYGYGSSDSRGMVDFYGLDPNQTYTAVLVKGAIAGIDGGEGSLSGSAGLGIAGATLNTTWSGLAPGAASHGYVLVAAGTNESTSGTFIGSGYDDTFFAGPGSNTYNGSGGWETLSGSPVWSATGGTDIVDFKLAGSTALSIDLSNSSAQSTGFNTATFKNIEGLAGGSGNDSFTDSASDNSFEGRGGNDTFNLIHGGHDTVLYRVLAGASANNTGGNGSDTVNGFKVGTWEGTPDTQRLDVHELLVGYTGDGSATYQNNVATLGAGAGNIASFLQVTQSGANTVIAMDRDGAGTSYSSATLATLQNVHTDLATLLANHQLTVV
ncbi:Ig-like domain-containing protein [Pseudomonas protegens]|uniref:Ig-like domain-containing protein n=1 Tax=Pseudomonas protegens TaxID=380021 RepID=UPI00383AA419